MDQNDSNLVSVTTFSRMREVSVVRVYQLIKEGRLEGAFKEDKPGGRILIDAEKANAMLDASKDPRAATGYPRSEPDSSAESRLEGASYNAARTQREKYNAELKKIEFEEAAGLLVNAEEIRTLLVNTAKTVRDALMNIPDRISPQLAAITDAFEIHLKLTEEIEQALRELGKMESVGK